MKNKKRILIILLILIVIVLVILGTVLALGGIKNNEFVEFKQDIENAACEYAENENFTKEICLGYENLCKVRYSTLINRKYLSADLVNPMTDKKISDDTTSYVQISWEDDKMICTYEEG